MTSSRISNYLAAWWSVTLGLYKKTSCDAVFNNGNIGILGEFAIVSIKKNCTLYRVMQSVFLSFYSHNRNHELLWSAHHTCICMLYPTNFTTCALTIVPETFYFSTKTVRESRVNGEQTLNGIWWAVVNCERWTQIANGAQTRAEGERWTHGKGKMNDLIRIALELSSDYIQINI